MWLEATGRSQLPEAWLGETSRSQAPSDPALLREASPRASQVRTGPSPPPSYSEATEDGQLSLSHSFSRPPHLNSSSEHQERSPGNFGALGLQLPLDMTEHDSSMEQMPDTPQHGPTGPLTGAVDSPILATSGFPHTPTALRPRPVLTYPAPNSPVAPFPMVNPWMVQYPPYPPVPGPAFHNPWLTYPGVVPAHMRGWLPPVAPNHMPAPANLPARLPPLRQRSSSPLRHRKHHHRHKHRRRHLRNHSHVQGRAEMCSET